VNLVIDISVLTSALRRERHGFECLKTIYEHERHCVVYDNKWRTDWRNMLDAFDLPPQFVRLKQFLIKWLYCMTDPNHKGVFAGPAAILRDDELRRGYNVAVNSKQAEIIQDTFCLLEMALSNDADKIIIFKESDSKQACVILRDAASFVPHQNLQGIEWKTISAETTQWIHDSTF